MIAYFKTSLSLIKHTECSLSQVHCRFRAHSVHSPEVEPAEVEVEGAEEGHEGEDVALAEGLGAAAGQQPLGHHGADVRQSTGASRNSSE